MHERSEEAQKSIDSDIVKNVNWGLAGAQFYNWCNNLLRSRWMSVGAKKDMFAIESLETWRTADKVGLPIGSESWLSYKQIDARIVAITDWVVHQKCEAQSDLLTPDSSAPYNYDCNEPSVARLGSSIGRGSFRELRYWEHLRYRFIGMAGWWHFRPSGRCMRGREAFTESSSYIRNMSWELLEGVSLVTIRIF